MILRKAKRREALCLCLCLCARAFEMMLWRCCSRSRIRVLGSIAGASCRRLLSSSPVHCKYLRNSYNGAEVYLLGTCHVSPDSVHRVREVNPHAHAQRVRDGETEVCVTTIFSCRSFTTCADYKDHQAHGCSGMCKYMAVRPHTCLRLFA